MRTLPTRYENTLNPWSLFREFENELSKQFSDANGVTANQRAFTPAIDVKEDDKSFLVKVDVPGIAKEDISVEVHNGLLTIKGERKFEKEENKGQWRTLERSYGSFSRTFQLPDNVNAEAVEATSKDGVLHIQLPKMESKAAKRIEIRDGAKVKPNV